ncbi:MAG TPA: response regulator [Patescibacteria group bacterium]|nr:response regulator [Patescibacteria group bacterium]
MPNTKPTDNTPLKPSGRPFVLVAEDDQFYANIYKVKLAKEGYDVTVVGNGEWVLSVAKKRKPNIILLDLVMPVMDGFETLKALKKDPELANINVIILSNLGQDEDIQTAKSLGAKDYLIKANNSIQEVVAKIKQYVG